MDDEKPPLGSLQAFKAWSDPRSWGPDGRWRVTFGSGVLPDFVQGLRELPAAALTGMSRKAEPYPVVLGCVPWLTSGEVVDALIEIGSCCVVVDKSSERSQTERLMAEGGGVFQRLLPSLEYWGPTADGKPPWIDPGSAGEFHERELKPVRLFGWRKIGNKQVPILHAKLAVGCVAYTWEGEMGGWDDHLTPLRVWMGSANWTRGTLRHLEFGAWSHDRALAKTALEFITDVIRASEPFDSTAVAPTPELVEGTWDNDAFAEMAAELHEAQLEFDRDVSSEPRPTNWCALLVKRPLLCGQFVFKTRFGLVEAAGVEPASEAVSPRISTSVSEILVLAWRLLPTGSASASRGECPISGPWRPRDGDPDYVTPVLGPPA